MTENTRRRRSKWDVVEEPQEPLIKTDEPPTKAVGSVDEFVSDSELNYSVLDDNRENSSLPSEIKDEPTMMNTDYEMADKITELSHIPKTEFQSPRFPKLPDLDANRDRKEGNDFGRVKEGRDKGLELNYGKSLSPGCNVRRQLSPTSPKRSRSRSHRSRSRSRSWSRSRSRSRSPSYSLRLDPERYRSRSPPYASRRGPEKWGVRDRTGGAPSVLCRNYAAGRCERGNACRFLHDSNSRRQSSRYYDSGMSDARESRGGRGRFPDSKEQSDYPRESMSDARESRGGRGRFPNSREQSDYPRESMSDARDSIGDSGKFPISSEQSDYPRESMSDVRESRGDRGRFPDSREESDLESKSNARESRGDRGRFPDSMEQSDYPRESMSDARQIRGDRGRFPDSREQSDHPLESMPDAHESRGDRGRFPDLREQIEYPREGMSDARHGRGDRGRFLDSREQSNYPRERFSSRNDRPPTACYDFSKGRCQRGSSCRYAHHDASHEARSRAYDEEPPRRQVRATPCKFFAEGQCRKGKACRFSHDVVGPHESSNSSRNDLNQSDNTAIIDISNTSSQWMGNNENNSRIDESMSIKPPPSLPLVTESNIYQNQLYVANQHIQPQTSAPPNVQISQLFPPIPLNGQMQPPIFQLPQNVQPLPFMASTIPMQNLPMLPPPQLGQTQQNYILPQLPSNADLGGQIPNLPLLAPLNGQNQPNFNFNGQTLNVAPQVPVSENLHLNEQSLQVNSDTSIAQKVVTSEQAAQIMNLSASLAQFFGSTQIAPGLVPISQPDAKSGNMEQGNIDNDNLPPGFDRKDSTIKEAETKTDADDGNLAIKGADPEVKVEVNVAETVDNKKEKDDDVAADLKADGEGKQSKDVKAMKMFKCALVEFVKDVLKPKWKEGHLSKEAHKTIVKKVVEKVTSATQSQSIPQTQDKIDLYFLHSKAKLTKLVQAYLEKYVKS